MCASPKPARFPPSPANSAPRSPPFRARSRALEEHLGARLLQRTTRSLALTEDGRDLLDHARRVLDAVEDAEAAVGRRHAAAGRAWCGWRRPRRSDGLYVAPRMNRLLERYPELSIELNMSDEVYRPRR